MVALNVDGCGRGSGGARQLKTGVRCQRRRRRRGGGRSGGGALLEGPTETPAENISRQGVALAQKENIQFKRIILCKERGDLSGRRRYCIVGVRTGEKGEEV